MKKIREYLKRIAEALERIADQEENKTKSQPDPPGT
jgi:hypothetical protein